MQRGVTRQDVLLMAEAYKHAMTGTGRQIRQRHGLSLETVSSVVGIGLSTLSRWETAQRRPSSTAAVEWARLLADLEAAA